jgi:hypothetical protein
MKIIQRERRTGGRLGACYAGAWKRLCDGGGAGGDWLGEENIRTAQPKLGKMVCIIHPEHEKSIRVAEKCGFKEVLRTTYKEEPTILFSR